MRNFLPVLAVVWLALALQTGGSLFGSKQHDKGQGPDFTGLSKILKSELKNNEQSQENLSTISSKLDKLSGPVKRAAEIVLELSKQHDSCDQSLILLLNEASSAHLRLDGHLRVEKVLRAPLANLLKLCSSYIDDKLQEELATLEQDPSLFRFHQMINSPNQFGLYDIQLDPVASRLNDYLAKLSEEDPKCKHPVSGKSMVFDDAQVFEYAFDKWLVGSCKAFAAIFGDVLAGAGSIDLIEGEISRSFSQQALERINPVAITNGICKHLTHLDAHKKATQFKQGVWTYDHKEGRRMPRKTSLIEKILF